MELSADSAGGRAAAGEQGGPIPPSRSGNPTAPVLFALRFIEGHLARDVRLDDVAAAAGVSRFQLSRMFATATGIPVMHYVRARRLTEAARSLACGAADILAVALDSGYASHEAFTRAFCSRFGVTPERLRARGSLDGLKLTQALITGELRVVDVPPPRIEEGRRLLIAGLRERYKLDTNQAIPMLWQSFVPRIASVPERAGTHTYGVHCDSDDEGGFEYIAGVEAMSVEGLPCDFVAVGIPARKYAVFAHLGHISGIRATVYSIWREHLPASGLQWISAPDFERYTEGFDPRTGNGKVEIWIPVR